MSRSRKLPAESAVVVVDADGRVVTWNAAAERLLGRSASSAIGRPCHEMVAARDVFGNRLCHANCAVQVMARQGEPVQAFQWTARSQAGTSRVSVSRRGAGAPGSYALVHVIDPDSTLSDQAVDAAAAAANLSSREREVLAHVVAGLTSKQMAAVLGIRVATVRNHVQNLLEKLGVHSKTEAAGLVLRQGFEPAADKAASKAGLDRLRLPRGA
jgi:DNA-binding CsgD family transcriptional regulator